MIKSLFFFATLTTILLTFYNVGQVESIDTWPIYEWDNNSFSEPCTPEEVGLHKGHGSDCGAYYYCSCDHAECYWYVVICKINHYYNWAKVQDTSLIHYCEFNPEVACARALAQRYQTVEETDFLPDECKIFPHLDGSNVRLYLPKKDSNCHSYYSCSAGPDHTVVARIHTCQEGYTVRFTGQFLETNTAKLCYHGDCPTEQSDYMYK